MTMALHANRAPHPALLAYGLDLTGMTLVVGLGKSGLSAIRTLVALGAEVKVADSRLQPPGLAELRQTFAQLPCCLGEFNADLFKKAARILVSPGVPLQTPAVKAAVQEGIPVWGDIELFARLVKAPVAAITGSNGKSTVTTLLGQMAEWAGVRVAVGGNLGTPALDLLRTPDKELYVLELSSFQLETTYSLNAQVATVLNISPDHMDRYSDLDAYSEAKRRIFRGHGCRVINADDPLVGAMAESDRRVVRFTLGEPEQGEFGLRCHKGQIWLSHGRDCWLNAAELKIRGAHNLANALAALAMGHALGFERSAMLAALKAFEGLPHRTQLVLQRSGVHWFNDSKGTNVGATVAAVNGLSAPLILIAGGDGKRQDFTPLRSALAGKARALILIGRDAPLIAAVMEATEIPVYLTEDMEQAVGLAVRLAKPGDSVLLSPACASFDMFSDYQERGAVFTAAVRRQVGC